MSTNRGDSGSFSLQYCAFRRTHTSADPFRLLYPTSFTLASLLALTICAQRKTNGLCYTSGPMDSVDFSCDSMPWMRGGGHTGQLLGPLVNTATITTVSSANRMVSGRFSSRCCAFRRTHTSADPIRLLYI